MSIYLDSHTHWHNTQKNGTALPSFLSCEIEKGITNKYDEETIKGTAAVMYSAGVDTVSSRRFLTTFLHNATQTVSTITTFILAATLYPKIMERAQQELDSVLGPGQFPTMADRQRLPYVEAIVKESMRWNVVLPMGMFPPSHIYQNICFNHRWQWLVI